MRASWWTAPRLRTLAIVQFLVIVFASSYLSLALRGGDGSIGQFGWWFGCTLGGSLVGSRIASWLFRVADRWGGR